MFVSRTYGRLSPSVIADDRRPVAAAARSTSSSAWPIQTSAAAWPRARPLDDRASVAARAELLREQRHELPRARDRDRPRPAARRAAPAARPAAP